MTTSGTISLDSTEMWYQNLLLSFDQDRGYNFRSV